MLIGAVLIGLFGFVVFFGAPYLPTLTPQAEEALDLLSLKPGDHMLELGCGDGKLAVMAAERGLRVTGYELNPILAAIAWLRTRKYRGRVRIVCGNFWRHDLPSAQGIFVFLLPKYMQKLDKKIMQEFSNPVKLVSFAFEVPGKKSISGHKSIFVYQY